MSLVADYSSTSSNSDDDDDESYEKNEECNEKAKLPLPSANVLLSSEKPGEVFSNPYKEAENAKIASLERHVKMVDSEEYLKRKNGKKICWNYRKGRCRFGSSCTFAHDSDLQSAVNQIEEGKETVSKDIPLKVTISKPQSGLQIGTSNCSTKVINSNCIKTINEHKLNCSVNNKNKQRRPGMNDSIVPSKKVMKQYNTLKKLEFS